MWRSDRRARATVTIWFHQEAGIGGIEIRRGRRGGARR